MVEICDPVSIKHLTGSFCISTSVMGHIETALLKISRGVTESSGGPSLGRLTPKVGISFPSSAVVD